MALFTRTTALSLLLLTALGALLRLHGLGRESVWYDEAVSILNAGLPLSQVVDNVRERDISPPLYFLGLHFWMDAVGRSDRAARALGVLMGVATIPLVFLLARRTHGENVALLASALAAISVPLISHSREARMYPLLVLLAVLSMERFVRFADRAGEPSGSREGAHGDGGSMECLGFVPRAAAGDLLAQADAWTIAALNLALAYTHLFGLFVPLTQLAILLVGGKPSRASILARVHLPVAALFLPWACVVANQAGERSSGFWIQPPSFLDIYAAVHFASFAYPWLSRLGMALALICVLCALARRRRARATHGDRWTLLLALAVALPIMLAFLVSRAVTPVFVSRYFLFSTPVYLILVAQGLLELPGHLVRPVALTLVCVLASQSVLADLDATRNADWRGATAWVAGRDEPVDLIVVTGNELCLHHYDKRPVPLYNTVVDPVRGRHAGPAELLARLSVVHSFWLFETAQGADLAAYHRAIITRFGPRESRTFRGIRVTRYAVRSPLARSSPLRRGSTG